MEAGERKQTKAEEKLLQLLREDALNETQANSTAQIVYDAHRTVKEFFDDMEKAKSENRNLSNYAEAPHS